MAVDLAKMAGAEIVQALGRTLTIRYKSARPGQGWYCKDGIERRGHRRICGSDPVSEVDHQVEKLIRARLADKFPRT